MITNDRITKEKFNYYLYHLCESKLQQWLGCSVLLFIIKYKGLKMEIC